MKKRRVIAKGKKFSRDTLNEVDAKTKADFEEISMSPEMLEKVVDSKAPWHKLVKDDPANDYNEVEVRMRQEEKVKQIFQTASQVLTEIQFKIFVMRYAYDLKQREIAKQLQCHQSYVPSVLKASVKKIKKRLQAEGIL